MLTMSKGLRNPHCTNERSRESAQRRAAPLDENFETT